MMKAYTMGFVLSMILTVGAFAVVEFDLLSGGTVVVVIALFAIVQAIVQLYYFLHLGEDRKPRLRLLSLVFMLLIMTMIVVGSLWIMGHLNYNMMQMSPSQKDDYMTTQKDKGF